jgi:hypothetical protein
MNQQNQFSFFHDNQQRGRKSFPNKAIFSSKNKNPPKQKI